MKTPIRMIRQRSAIPYLFDSPPWALFKFLDLESGRLFEVGAYSRLGLIKFSPFSTSVVCIFCKKAVNGNNKTRRCNKARFPQNTLKKTPSWGKSQISTYSFFWVVAGREWALIWVWVGVGGRWGGVGVGANSRLGAYLNKYGIWKTKGL